MSLYIYTKLIRSRFSLGAQTCLSNVTVKFSQKVLCESSFSDKFGSLGAHIVMAWETYLNLSCWVENI